MTEQLPIEVPACLRLSGTAFNDQPTAKSSAHKRCHGGFTEPPPEPLCEDQLGQIPNTFKHEMTLLNIHLPVYTH